MLNVTMINRPCGIAYACSKLFMLCSAASKNRASGSHTRLLVKKHQNKLHQRWKCKEIGYLTITFFFYAISLSWKAIKSVIQWGIGGGRSSFYSILFMWVKCVYLRWLPRKALGSSSGRKWIHFFLDFLPFLSVKTDVFLFLKDWGVRIFSQ